jgi:hypothetical protein
MSYIQVNLVILGMYSCIIIFKQRFLWNYVVLISLIC